MTVKSKIDAVKKEVAESKRLSDLRKHTDWLAHFSIVVDRIDNERVRRNSIMHAQYLFNFFDRVMGPPLMIDPRRTSPDGKRNIEPLDKAYQARLTEELWKLAMDVHFVHVQLLWAFSGTKMLMASPSSMVERILAAGHEGE